MSGEGIRAGGTKYLGIEPFMEVLETAAAAAVEAAPVLQGATAVVDALAVEGL